MPDHFQNFIIHDKHGRPYSVLANDCDPQIYRRFIVKHRSRRIGYVNYHVEGDDVFFIDDFCFYDKAMRPPWFFMPFGTGSFPPERWRVTNYQGCGLGTAMIEFLKGFAKSETLKRIEGVVQHNDFKRNPDLPDWYRRRGFTVTTENITVGVAKISLTI